MDFRKIAIVIVLIIGLVLLVRFVFGGAEDTWLCQKGQWVKHGNPKDPAPSTGCGSASPTPAMGKTALYKTSDFEITYPVWSNIPKENLLDPTITRIAVVNNNCNFLVTAKPIPKDQVFKTYIQKVIDDEIAANNVKTVKKEIKDKTSFVESSFLINNTAMYSASNGYFTSERQFYSVIFVSSKEAFETSCRPFIKEIIGSVKVK